MKDINFNDALKSTCKQIDLEVIIRTTASVTHVPEHIMCEKSRKMQIVLARGIVWYLAQVVYAIPLSIADLAKRFGDFDHTTVIHQRESIRNRYSNDDSVRNMINEIIFKINAI